MKGVTKTAWFVDDGVARVVEDEVKVSTGLALSICDRLTNQVCGYGRHSPFGDAVIGCSLSFAAATMSSMTSRTDSRNVYWPPDMSGVDCDDMRPLEMHARYLDYLMERVLRFDPGIVDDAAGDPGDEWDQVRQWLQMVAGLRYVDVLPVETRGAWLCKGALEYDNAKNDLISDVATEETRLLYAWGAVERLLKVVRLPELADRKANGRDYNRASQLIGSAFPEGAGLPHYEHVVAHMLRHARGDWGLRDDTTLQAAGMTRPWRNPNSVLLPLGAAMRNIPAHGDSRYGEPIPGDDGADGESSGVERRRSLSKDAHAPRLACRGLLFSLQQLLAITAEVSEESDFDAEELGWPCLIAAHVKPGAAELTVGSESIVEVHNSWATFEQPTSWRLLFSAHLRPPSELT